MRGIDKTLYVKIHELALALSRNFQQKRPRLEDSKLSKRKMKLKILKMTLKYREGVSGCKPRYSKNTYCVLQHTGVEEETTYCVFQHTEVEEETTYCVLQHTGVENEKKMIFQKK